MKRAIFRQLKDEFHYWCGLLSVDECVGNGKLIELIEEIERLLIKASNA